MRQLGEAASAESGKAVWSEPAGAVAWRAESLVISMPLVASTMTCLLDHAAESNVTGIDIVPILSQQDPPDTQDTAPLRSVVESLAGKRGPVAVEVLEPWLIAHAPHDYGAMVDAYLAFYEERYREVAPRYAHRFFQITPGTPAMSFAAAVFGRDSRLTFLYTPRTRTTDSSDATRPVTAFTQQHRKHTDDLVATLARRYDWGGIAVVLASEGNGYTPVGGLSSTDETTRARHAAACALDAWSDRDFAEAAKHASLVPAADDFIGRCDALASMSPNAAHHASVWLSATEDAFERLRFAVDRDDPPATIVALYTFSEAILLWCLATSCGPIAARPHLNSRLLARIRRRYPAAKEVASSEAAILQAVLIADNKTLRPWVRENMLPFAWVLQNCLDPIRNRLLHGGTTISSAALQAALTNHGVNASSPLPTQLLHAAHHLLETARGNDPALNVAGLHTRILDPQMAPLPPDGRARAETMTAWREARSQGLRQRHKQLRNTIAGLLDGCEALGVSEETTNQCLVLLAVDLEHDLVLTRDTKALFIHRMHRTLKGVDGRFGQYDAGRFPISAERFVGMLTT